MLNANEKDIISPSTKDRFLELEARKEELNISILQEQPQKTKLTKEQIIGTFVNRIYVYDGKLVLTYNYKDETDSITPEDVQKAFGSDLKRDAPSKKSLGFVGLKVFFIFSR